MYINVQVITIHFDPKGNKWKFMLHDQSFIPILNSLGNDLVFYIPAIEIIILKSAVSSGNFRFSHKAFDLHKIIFIGDFQKCFGDLPSVNAVDHILYAVISVTVKFHLTILDIFKGNFRVGKGKLLHHGSNIIGL